MERWRSVWRVGVAPLLNEGHLEALRRGLAENDPRLIQGATTEPTPLQCVQDWPVDAACALGYCGWIGDDLGTVGEVSGFFNRLLVAIDKLVGEPGGCRFFINWFDETPRSEMRAALLAEVELTLRERKGE